MLGTFSRKTPAKVPALLSEPIASAVLHERVVTQDVARRWVESEDAPLGVFLDPNMQLGRLGLVDDCGVCVCVWLRSVSSLNTPGGLWWQMLISACCSVVCGLRT